jgi:hypothetical protein
MDGSLAEVCCASVPAASLAWLAPLRVHAGIRVCILDERAWLWWEAGDEVVLRHVLSLHDIELFTRREGRWYRAGQHLPAFEVPSREAARPLLHVLTPSPVQAEPHAPSFRPMRLTLVREDRPRATSALCCSLAELGRWAEEATSKHLAQLTAIHSGQRVLLRGERLSSLPGTERYWGRTVLTPLGFRPEPAMSEGVLREALGLRDEEIALLGEDGFEAIDARRFQPLTRASVRLALREVH